MANSLISNRVLFGGKQQQQAFIRAAKKSLCVNWTQLAQLLTINRRTLGDWATGKFNMPHDVAQALSRASKILLPSNVRVVTWHDHLKSIAQSGGMAVYRKYGTVGGDARKRKQQWERWWEHEGKFKKRPISERKHVRLPKKNALLAEFVGIMMGDGGISKYHCAITLNAETDRAYAIVVSKLIKKLFGVEPKKYFRKDSKAMDLVIHSRNVVDFCHSIGLKIGNKLKQKLDIPRWIKQSREFQMACLRGLVDTDGSFFIHAYTVRAKKYSYVKIGFTSHSPFLIKSVVRIMRNFGLNAKINYNGRDVKLESGHDVKKYMARIGTHNAKHREKFTVTGRVAPNGKAAVC